MANETQSIIIYRNQSEQLIDQALYQNGGAVYFFIFLCAAIAFIIGAALAPKISLIARMKQQKQEQWQLIIGGVLAVVVTYILWI
jgi:uncharacterized membrane protein HdeD (DUF308 family)